MDNELLDGFYLNESLVQPTTGEVSRAEHSVHLPSKAMEVLLRLARNARHLVTRDELLEQVWGDRERSPEVLTHAISDIRRALDDHAETPRYIQTVPTRGYRLLVEPSLDSLESPDETAEASGAARSVWQALLRHGVVQAGVTYLVAGWLLIQIADTTFEDIGLPAWSEALITFAVIGGFPIVILLAWFLEFAGGRMSVDHGRQSGSVFSGLGRNYLALFIAFGVAGAGAGVYQAVIGFDVPGPEISLPVEPELVPIAENSLAVLKLLTIGTDERLRLFSDGLSEDIIDALARLPGLSVSSRGDSWSLPPNATSNNVRKRLRVAHFVEGSVRQIDENSLRVVVQLIDSDTGFHVVSRGFDFEVSELANLEKEITRLIVANLRLALDFDEVDIGLLPPEQTVIDAYLSYRRGREELLKPRSKPSISAAIAYFEEALEIDDGYPAAHAGVCSAYTFLYQLSRDPADIARAEDACARAYTVGSQLPLVLHAIGNLNVVTGSYDAARGMYERALEIDGRHASSTRGLARVAERQGDFGEAEALYKRAIDMQPGNWNTMNSLAGLYFRRGRYAQAASEYQKLLFIDPENFAIIANLGAASLMAGDLETARDAMQESLAIEFNPFVASNLGIVYYYMGDYARSVEIHEQVVAVSPKSSGNRVNLGDAQLFLGDAEGAQASFRTAVELARAELGVNPKDAEALTYLAWALTATGAIEEGRQVISRALEMYPSDPYAHYFSGLIRLHNGERDGAVEAFSNALEFGYEASLLAMEPYLESLHANQRFSDLLAESAETGEKK